MLTWWREAAVPAKGNAALLFSMLQQLVSRLVFTGREVEIDLFERSLKAYEALGQPHILAYVGILGSGKSHLLAELAFLGQAARHR